MKGILWVSGFKVDDSEMEEIRKTIHRINKKRKAEKREKLDYICTTSETAHISRKLENR